MGPVNGHVRTCELSSSDHWTFPAALKDIGGHEYCPIKVTTHSHEELSLKHKRIEEKNDGKRH